MLQQIVGEQNSGTISGFDRTAKKIHYPAAAWCSDVSLFHIDEPFVMQYSVQQYSNGLVLLFWIWGMMDFL
jgi:hypothetical protein